MGTGDGGAGAVLVRAAEPADQPGVAALLASAGRRPADAPGPPGLCVATAAGPPEFVIGYGAWWQVRPGKFRMDLRRHREDLAGVPVAVFGMGPREDRPESWRRAREQLDHALAKRPWLAPAAVAVFGGVDPPGLSNRHARRDLRDWAAIRHWAQQVADGAA